MMTREVFAMSWAKEPATPKPTARIIAAANTCSLSLPRGMKRLRPCALSRISSVAEPML